MAWWRQKSINCNLSLDCLIVYIIAKIPEARGNQAERESLIAVLIRYFYSLFCWLTAVIMVVFWLRNARFFGPQKLYAEEKFMNFIIQIA